jgi:hypothetical protein
MNYSRYAIVRLSASAGKFADRRVSYLAINHLDNGQPTGTHAQLASENLTERLGGIYALEHLMLESERDHQTVVDVLAAFVRARAPISESTATIGPVGVNHRPDAAIRTM